MEVMKLGKTEDERHEEGDNKNPEVQADIGQKLCLYVQIIATLPSI